MSLGKPKMENARESCLRVYCLGTFQVLRPDEPEPIGVGSRQKTWSLFKYLLVNKGTAVPTETVMDMFWPDNDDTAPLRTAISRLRAALEPESSPYRRGSYVACTRDTCSLRADAPIWLDVEEFEGLCRKAHALGEDRTKAVGIYLEALPMYKGDFLAEDLYTEWTIIPREHYRQLFLSSVIEAANWLLGFKDYAQARRILQDGIQIDPFMEELHILLMEALIKMGDLQGARDHYTQSTSLLYQELGIRPSREFKEVYRRAKSPQDTPANSLADALAAREQAKGAFVCEAELFPSILLLERRRLARNNAEASIVFLDVDAPEEELEDLAAEIINKVANISMRTGDVICRLDETHFALLLPSTSVEGSATVTKRIQDRFGKESPSPKIGIRMKVKAVAPLS